MKTHGTECKIHGKGSKISPAVLFLGTGYPDESLAAYTCHVKSQVTTWGSKEEARAWPFPNCIDSLANSAPVDKHFENGEEISS